MNQNLHVDIVIFGGGITGLWLLNRLRSIGYSTILLERGRLGSGQTNASQGMIHGGIKYSLSGFFSESARTIADMPDYWKYCLAGEADVNLNDVNVLSNDYYLCSDGSAGSTLMAFLGSKSVRGKVDRLGHEDYPPAFQHKEFRGNVYRLNDVVVDVHSLINSLYQQHREAIFQLDTSAATRLVANPDGGIKHVNLGRGSSLKAKRYVFCAGEGNEALLSQSKLTTPLMQRRPLHQVFVRHHYDKPVFAHFVDIRQGATPRLTVTTHKASDGHTIWNLGGELAESGVGKSDHAQIDAARKEIAKLLPWIQLQDATWRTLNINRAEPRKDKQARPDEPFVDASSNILTAWPVKLTMAPMIADKIIALIESQQVHPSSMDLSGLNRILTKPAMAQPIWQTLF